MRLTINGADREVAAELDVAALVTELTGERRGVAVAVNGAVVPRSTWASVRLLDGDWVEVLSAAQGG
jgi:sulfur carrier protein